jgi:Tfp pilus assembly protein PilX
MNGSKRGFALITVLAIVIMLTLGITAMLQFSYNQSKLQGATIMGTSAQYVAEAGMQQVLWSCRDAGCSANVVNMAMPSADPNMTTTYTISDPPAGNTALAGTKQIDVTVTYTDV